MCARGHGLLCSLAGKKEKKSTIVKCSLNPVWTNEHLVFSKTPSLEKTIQKGITLGIKDSDDGAFDSDDLIGKVRVDLNLLEDHSTVHYLERIKPQGIVVFSITWQDCSDGAPATPGPATPGETDRLLSP